MNAEGSKGGGILPKVAPLLFNGGFEDRFLAKGAMRGYLETIPVHLIQSDDAALLGALLPR